MVNLSQDIHPLTDFKRHTSEFMNQLKETRRPVVLTVNGKAELVVQDVETYQKTLDRLEQFEAVEAIRVGIAAAEQGRVKPARQALAALQEQLGIRDRHHRTRVSRRRRVCAVHPRHPEGTGGGGAMVSGAHSGDLFS